MTHPRVPFLSAFFLLALYLNATLASAFRSRSELSLPSRSNDEWGDAKKGIAEKHALTHPPASASLADSSARRGRGGMVVNTVTALLRTAVQNPLLILLMAGSSITVVYKDQLSYARQIQGLLQVLIAGYVFYLLVRWQQNTASSDNKYG